MSSTREIKRRIRSVQNTQQITKAMEMVAAAKLRRAEVSLKANRPYTKNLYEFMGRLIAYSTIIRHPLIKDGEEKDGDRNQKRGYLVVTSDRGLCGGYNSNLLRKVTDDIKENSDPEQAGILIVGRKGRDFFRRRGYNLLAEYLYLEDNPAWNDILDIGRIAVQMMEDGVYGELYLVYNQFISAIQQRQVVKKLLPIDKPRDDELPEVDETLYFQYEPSSQVVLDELINRYIYNSVYAAVLEAKASEHGARMAAMGAATTNAVEMIEKLTHFYNQARQAGITQEILEIVNSAEALRQG